MVLMTSAKLSFKILSYQGKSLGFGLSFFTVKSYAHHGMLVAVCFASAVSVHVLFLITSVLCQVENFILTFICPASFNSPSRDVWQGKSAESSYIYFFLSESCGQMH